MEISLDGWSIGSADAEWAPWAPDGNAREQVLAGGEGCTLVLVKAQSGYRHSGDTPRPGPGLGGSTRQRPPG
jgi:hypothetical protein